MTAKDRFDILGLDCCFMAHLETLARFADVARFIVAAPSAVPLISWPYRSVTEIFEARFQPDNTAASAASIATAGRDYFVENREFECPVLALDSSKIGDAVRAQHAFGAVLTHLATEAPHAAEWKLLISVARSLARCHYLAPDYCELESFAEELLREISRALGTAGNWIEEVDPGRLQELRDRADEAIRASSNSLIFPAPIRGGDSPRSVLVWFPVQKGLFELNINLYSELVKRLQQNGVLADSPMPGWLYFLNSFHDDARDVVELGDGGAAGGWLMGLPNRDKMSLANLINTSLQLQ